MAEIGAILGSLGFLFGVLAYAYARNTGAFHARRCAELQREINNLKLAILLPTREEIREMFAEREGFGKRVPTEDAAK
jgi:hypothetical protein